MSVSVEVLKASLREKFPQAHDSMWESATESVDFTPVEGAIHELVCPSSQAGHGLVLYHLLHQCEHGQVALVDALSRFDPTSQGEVACETLLWLRCKDDGMVWKLTDWLLKDGNLPLVILDIRDLPMVHKTPRSFWYRLRNHAEESHVALVVLSSDGVVPCAQRLSYVSTQWGLEALEVPREELVKVFSSN